MEPFHTDLPVLADQPELTYNSSVRTEGVFYETCWKRWMIRTNDEKESGKSVLAAQLGDDDDDDIYIYILST